MPPPVFYSPPGNFADTSVRLPKAELHHATRVLRLKTGRPVVVVNGQGGAIRGELVSLSERDTSHVRIMHHVRNYGEPLVELTLASGLSTGSKLDGVVQRGTELGVSRFVPILSDKSKVKLDDPRRAQNRIARLEKVALAAMKQCRRSRCPEIASPCSLSQFLEQIDTSAANLVFHPGSSADLTVTLSDSNVRKVSALVGPESGFAEEEMRQAVQAGFVAVSLGERVMRTETAGPVVCGLIMHHLGELR